MLVLNERQVFQRLAFPALIDAIREAFAADWRTPPRQVVDVPGGEGRLLLSMPAFSADGAGCVKLATVFPGNDANGLPTIQGVIIAFDKDGKPVAQIDGGAITKMRTAATSALASTYLSRPESSHLVMIGAGALAPFMVDAHCAARPIRHVTIWARDRSRAEAVASASARLVSRDVDISVAGDLGSAVAQADIVCCVTSAATPLLKGQWLRPGAHVDLVGGFSPEKREADDEVVKRACLFADTYEGALSEAGDFLIPIASGAIERSAIKAELRDLVTGRYWHQREPEEITLFKSVGSAIEDLAAARLAISVAPRDQA